MRFTKKDLEIFEVPGFADRMQLIADTIRPKLAKLGELLNPQLSRLVGHELYTHVALHARRTVNPPEETWVAFSPDKTGYKSYVHLALCVGRRGVQARAMVKQECADRKRFSNNLLSQLEPLSHLKGHKEMEDYTHRDAEYKPATVADWNIFLKDASRKLKENNTSCFDVGANLPLSGDLSSHAIQAFARLSPFYLLGHNLPWAPPTNGNGW